MVKASIAHLVYHCEQMFNFRQSKAMAIGKKGRVHVEDIVFLIRKDPKKYARVKV